MSDPTGYQESPDTSDVESEDNLIDGTSGHNRPDRGERDTQLTTDDDAQQEDGVERPGNAPD